MEKNKVLFNKFHFFQLRQLIFQTFFSFGVIPGTEEPGGLQSTGSQTWTRLSDFASLWFLLAASRGEAGKSWPARREPSPGTGLWLVGQGGAGSVGDVDGWGGEGEEEHR